MSIASLGLSGEAIYGDKPTTSGKTSCVLTNVAIYAALIAFVAASVLVGNEITKAVQNGGDLQQWVVDIFEGIAKWSAIAAGTSAVFAVIFYGIHRMSLPKEHGQPPEL